MNFLTKAKKKSRSHEAFIREQKKMQQQKLCQINFTHLFIRWDLISKLVVKNNLINNSMNSRSIKKINFFEQLIKLSYNI